MSDQNDVISNLKMVCQCRGIRQGAIKKVISGGKTTLVDVQKSSGAGSGDCGGRRCTPRINDLLEK